MTKIGYEQIKPAGTPQGNIPPAIDSSLQGAPGSKPNEEVQPQKQDDAPTASQPAQPTGKEQPASDTPDYKADLINYDNQINILKKEQAYYASANETEEERKKREKRERAKRVIAAVGDGIRALSNLYFTSQYAPNMYNPDDTQLAKVDARQEKLKAEREANRDKYLKYSLRIGDLQNDRAKTVREMEAQAEKLRLAREKADREQEEHKWLADLQPDKKREQTAKANAADSVAKTKQIEADNADAIQKAKLKTEQERGKTEQERGKTERTKQNVNRATAKLRGVQIVKSGAKASDRSNRKEFIAYDEKGRPHSYRTKAEADAYAKQHGTFREENKTERTTITDKSGNTTYRTKTSSSGGYSQNPKKKFSSFSIHK